MLFGVGDVGIEVEWRGFKMLMDTRSKSRRKVLPRSSPQNTEICAQTKGPRRYVVYT